MKNTFSRLMSMVLVFITVFIFVSILPLNVYATDTSELELRSITSKSATGEYYLSDEMANRFCDLFYGSSSVVTDDIHNVLTGKEEGTYETIKGMYEKISVFYGVVDASDVEQFSSSAAQKTLGNISFLNNVITGCFDIIDNHKDFQTSRNAAQKTLNGIQMFCDILTICQCGHLIPSSVTLGLSAIEVGFDIAGYLQEIYIDEAYFLYESELKLAYYAGDTLPFHSIKVTLPISVTQKEVDAVCAELYFYYYTKVLLDNININYGQEEQPIEVEGVSFSVSQYYIFRNELLQITAGYYPANATVGTSISYHSSDTSIFTVDAKGNITVVSHGTANLIAISGNGKQATLSLTILPYEVVENSSGYAITKYYGNGGNVVIPSCSANGIVISEIKSSVFANCTGLTSVTIPNSITSIGQSTFQNCSNLTAVTISGSITSIDNSVFKGCVRLTSITIPDSVTSIGDSAFERCTSLISITIPDSVTSIGDSAFQQCTSLTSITIPDSVTSIGDDAFYYCSSLTSVTIPDSVTSIGDHAFEFCTNLSGIWVDENNKSFSSDANGVLFNKKKTIILQAPGAIQAYTIPDNVTDIGDYAFRKCHGLTSLTIGNGVSRIGIFAFYHCTSLTSITIPDGVTSISSYAFYGCSSLTSVTIGDAVTSIGLSAFEECSSLTSVTIPDSVTSIGSFAFFDCFSLTSVTIPDSVTSIGSYAFNNCRLTDVYFCGTAEQWNAISILKNDHLIKANLHYHDYGDYVVYVAPTLTTGGYRKKSCHICGDIVTEILDMLLGKVSQWNITLEDNIAVNFYLHINKDIEDCTQVYVKKGKEMAFYDVSALSVTEEGYLICIVDISAAQMNEPISIQIINGDVFGEIYTYTARQYCDTILADEAHSEYHALVKEMLNYGAMAQIYFDYDTGYLANEGITGTATTEIPEIVEDLTVTDKISDLSFYGASLVYRDRIAVRYYFTDDVTGCTFTANGNTYTPVAKDGMYYIEIADILPQYLDQQIALIVTDAEGNALTVTYGPMNYIVRMNEKGSAELQNLVKALYNYHLASKALSVTV